MLCEPVMANTDGLRNETAPLSGVRAVQIWPWLLAGFAAAAMVALALPLRLPLGSFYWDLVVYLDAFQRIRTGQAPALDFFAPVGPLGYYLGYAMQRVFPNAQPLLLTNWALMPVLLPLVAAILSQRGASRHALALLLPFLIFVALPINLFGYYPSPGLDGYGIYNRHTATLLYWLAATLIFVEGPRARTALVAMLMLALFLTKITGAVVGAMMVGYACLIGRMRLGEAILAALGWVIALLVIDWPAGLVRAYLADVFTLIRMNTGTLLPRLLYVASGKFAVVVPAAALVALLCWIGWQERDGPPSVRLRRILAGPAGWLVVTLAASALFETQNSGSLDFIALWPALLLIILDWRSRSDAMRPAVLVLALAVALPSVLFAIERGARALVGTIGDTAVLSAPELGPLGRVNLKRSLAQRAETMVAFYGDHQDTYQALVAKGLEPSAILYGEIDYQATWLLEVRQGLIALRQWEQREQRRLNGVFTLDFVDPFNALLDRAGPLHVSIGAMPGRSVPPLDARTLASLAETDAILVPKCPPTPARADLAKHFQPALAGRQAVALSPCWEMFVRPR